MSLTIFLIPRVIPGIHVDALETALAVALVLGLLNLVVKPILLFLTFPLTIMSLGLFIFVLNAFIFEFAGSLVSGFRVDSFSSAFFAALIVSFVSWVSAPSKAKFRVKTQTSRPRMDSSTIDLNQSQRGHWE